VSCPVFIFCTPGLVLGCTEGVGSRFHVCVPGLILDGTKGVRSRFHVLRSRTHFRRYRGRRVSFSYSTLPYFFWAVPRASGSVFMFCAPELAFDGTMGGTEGVRSRYPVLRSQTHFRRNRGRRVSFSYFALSHSFWAIIRVSGPIFMICALILVFGVTLGAGSSFHVLHSRTRFGQFRGRRLPFFMFSCPELIFVSTEGAGSSLHVLRSLTHFGC
jgi:hypothetical protein